MPLNNFTRPNLPYVNQPLPNDNRFEVITRVLKQPITFDILEGEINSIIDKLNKLDIDLNGVVAGAIPGSNNPLNANKLLTTNGGGNLSFVNVTNANIDDGSLSGIKITPSSIGTLQLGNGVVTQDKIPNMSLSYGKMNFDDGVLPGSKLFNKSVTQGQLGLLSVGTPELIDDSVKTAKIQDDAITNAKIADGSITLIKLAQEVLDAIIPIGCVMAFAGTIGFSARWLECNGEAISRVTYATLFANLGTIYGIGDGATTFNLPDWRGRVPVGIGSDNSTGGLITNATAPNITLGKTGVFGEERHKLIISEIPSHTHDLTYANSNTGNEGFLPDSNVFRRKGPTGATGEDQPHNNTQPSIFTTYYIRAL